MDPPGVEPGSPICHTGVFPLDHGPALQWTAGESNSDSRLAKPVSSQLDEQPETVIPHGLEPWFPACDAGVVAAGPRDRKAVPTGVDPVPLPRQGSMQCRYTKAPKSVSEVGVEPTKSPPSQDGCFAGLRTRTLQLQAPVSSRTC